MTIPKYCYDLSKAPSEYKVGDSLCAEEFKERDEMSININLS